MSSLWTPGGEHRVDPAPPSAPRGTGARSRSEIETPPTDAELDEGALTDLAAFERQLLATPAADVVANHCYGLFELAALHLRQQPPHLEEARLAIDAFGAVVETLEGRLGAAGPTLRDGLAQIRLAFVQLSSVPGAGEPGAEGAGS